MPGRYGVFVRAGRVQDRVMVGSGGCRNEPSASPKTDQRRFSGLPGVPGTTARCIVRLPLALRYLILLCSIAFCACADAAPRVLAVDVDSIVHPVTVEIVSRALDQASRENYDLVLIRLNTPGGLMDAIDAQGFRPRTSRQIQQV